MNESRNYLTSKYNLFFDLRSLGLFLKKSRVPLNVISQHFSSLHICSISQMLMVHASISSLNVGNMVTTNTLSSALSFFIMTRSVCILNITICAQFGDFTEITMAHFKETCITLTIVSDGSLEASWMVFFSRKKKKKASLSFLQISPEYQVVFNYWNDNLKITK